MANTTVEYINIKQTKIPIIFEKQKNLPIFNLQMIFKNSGYMRDGSKKGLSDITAKILEEGTKKLGATEFATKLENSAIQINASSGFETFVIEVSCLKEQKFEALELLDDLLKDPNLSNKILEKLQKLQLGKLKRKENDFDYIANRQLKKMLFSNTPLEYGLAGDSKSIMNINIKDIEGKIDNLLNLDNLILTIGGEVEISEISENLIVILEKFKNQKSNNIDSKITVSVDSKEEKTIKDTQQAYVYFGSPFYLNYDDEENYKAKILSFILGSSGFGSRLMENIRVDKGLAYSVSGYTTVNKSYSMFSGYLQTKIENEQKAKKLVVKIVDEFVAKGATQKELDIAKKFILGSEPLRSETLSQRLNRAFNAYYRNVGQDYFKEELKPIEDLTLSDLNKFIRSHNEINKLSFSIVTNKESK